MGASVVVTQFALRTTNGTTDITVSGAGTLCRGAWFFMGGGLTDGTVRNHSHNCIGWVDSSGNAAVGHASDCEDGQANTDTGAHWSASFCIGVNADGGGIDGAYSHSAFITDGIRITTSNPSSRALLVKAVLFFGSDVTLVDGSITPSSAFNNEDTVDIGQDSDVILWSHIDSTGAADTYANHSILNAAISTWDGTTLRQRGFRVQIPTGQATENVRQTTGPRLDWNYSTGTSIDRAMECTTMDSNLVGITSRETTAPNDRPYRFCSVNFNGTVEARVEALTLPTSGNLSSTAYGFKPQFMLFGFINVTSQVTETGSFTDVNDGISCLGAMDGTREHSCGWANDDGNTTSSDTSITADNVLFCTDVSDATDLDGDHSSFDANGFTITMNTNPGATMEGWGLAIEEEAAAGDQEITVGTIALASSVLAPAQIDQTLPVGTVAVASSVVAPTLDQTINVGTISLASSVLAPSQVNRTLPVGTIALASSVTTPTLNQTIPVGLVGLSSSILAPTMSAAGDQTITVGIIGLASSITTPTLNQTLSVPAIALASSVVAPTLNQTIPVGSIALVSSITSPDQVNRTLPVSPITLASSILAPSQINQTLPVPVIPLASSILAPTTGADQNISVGTIALASSVLSPTLNQTVSVPAIAVASSILAPIQVDQTIVVGAINLAGSVLIPILNQTLPVGTVALASSVVTPGISAAPIPVGVRVLVLGSYVVKVAVLGDSCLKITALGSYTEKESVTGEY